MRTAEITRIADLVATEGRTARQIMLEAVETALAADLTVGEVVAVIDELERRLRMRLHPAGTPR